MSFSNYGLRPRLAIYHKPDEVQLIQRYFSEAGNRPQGWKRG